MTAAEFNAFIEGMCIEPGKRPTLEQWGRLKVYVARRLTEERSAQRKAPTFIETTGPALDVPAVKDLNPGSLRYVDDP